MRIVPCLAVALLLVAGPACAAGMYKWADKDGNVQFGDQPDGSAPATEVTIKGGRADPEAVERMKRQQHYLDARAEERADGKAKEADTAKKNEQLAADCIKLKQNLDHVQQHPRLYRENEKGERVYLTGPERDAEIAKTQALIDEHCK